MAGAKFPTRPYTAGSQPDIRNLPPSSVPSIHSPGNVYWPYPPNTLPQAPHLRQNVPNVAIRQGVPNITIGQYMPNAVEGKCQSGIGYPVGSLPHYPYAPINQYGQERPNPQQLSHPTNQYVGQTYPSSYPSSGKTHIQNAEIRGGMPNLQQIQNTGGTGWTPVNRAHCPSVQNKSPPGYPPPKRSAENFSGLDNPPSKRLKQDQCAQPYSVQVNGYQKGLHIEGSCYLTVRQKSNQVQTPPVSSAAGFSSVNQSLPLQTKSASYGMGPECVQGHLDVSVTPVVTSPPLQMESAKVFNKESARRIILTLLSIICNRVPKLSFWFSWLKREEDVLCISEELCRNLIPWLTIPKERTLLQLFNKHRRELCNLENEGRCSECSSHSGKRQNLQYFKGGKERTALGYKSDMFSPCSVQHPGMVNGGQTVVNQSIQNGSNLYSATPSIHTSNSGVNPSGLGLDEKSNPQGTDIASTFLSESEFRDNPFSASVKVPPGVYQNGNIVPPMKYSSPPPYPQNGMRPYSTLSSVCSMQGVANKGNFQQSGNVNSCTAYPPRLVNNGQGLGGFPPVSSARNNVTGMPPLKTVSAKPKNNNVLTSGIPQGETSQSYYQAIPGANSLTSLNSMVSSITRTNLSPNSASYSGHPPLTYPSDKVSQSQQTNLQTMVCTTSTTGDTPSTRDQSPMFCSSNAMKSPALPPPLVRSMSASTDALPQISPTFRQQAAVLMKLPEGTTDQKTPVSSPSSTPDVMNCFTVKPPEERKILPMATPVPKGSSSGMTLPCIVIEDSDEEDSVAAKAVETSAANYASSDNRSRNIKAVDLNHEEGSVISSNSLALDSFPLLNRVENNNESTIGRISEQILGENSSGLLPNKDPDDKESVCVQGKSSDKGVANEATPKADRILLSDALKQIEDEESLEALVASGEAKFATFVFDEGTGDMEITTAEFGEEDWEQLMRG